MEHCAAFPLQPQSCATREDLQLPEIVAVRCLKDNYAWLLHHDGHTVLFDAPDAPPIIAALADRDWTLSEIALTHHHADHIQGVPALVSATGAAVIGNAADSSRLPPLDLAVRPGDPLRLAGLPTEVLDVPGHTIGHIAFHVPAARAAFTGDSLMAIGCGRVFEGTPAQMWESLSLLNALPEETLICSGHDYCEGNARFALSVEPGNTAIPARLRAGPCAPVTLAEERATNPFLRTAEIAPLIGMGGAEAGTVFARLRAMKDSF